MSKRLINRGISDGLRSEIERYSSLLQSYIDKSTLERICKDLRNRNERLFAYNGIIRDACCECFRATEISCKGTKNVCVVWGFDGRIWRVISPSIFMDVVGDALVRSAGSCGFVVIGDWVSKKGEMLASAYSGVCSSSLGVSPSSVGFSNGVWDFADIDNPVYHGFDDRLPVTDLLPYDYDPDATCPLWLSFLNMMLSPKDVLKLQKYLGLGVVNRYSMRHKVEDTLWLIGGGANGKSTILDVVKDVYGNGHISVNSMRELLDRTPDNRMRAIAEIDGKTFNLCSEMDVSDITKDSEAFKRLCSGEAHNARHLGHDIYKAENIPFLIFSMNHRPSNYKMDSAFRRRIVEIVFRACVKPEDMDTQLGARLRDELPGIRNWMIEGYKKLRADDFLFEHTNDEEYQESNEQYFDIFAKHEGLRPSAWAGHDEVVQLVGAHILLDRYTDFCKRKMINTDRCNDRAMGLDLKRLNFRKVRKASGVYYEVYCDRVLDYSVKV